MFPGDSLIKVLAFCAVTYSFPDIYYIMGYGMIILVESVYYVATILALPSWILSGGIPLLTFKATSFLVLSGKER